MSTRLRKLVRALLGSTNVTGVLVAGATERLTITSYKITNYGLVPVDISVWWGAATDDNAMVKLFTLDAAPSAGKTGGAITNDSNEIHTLEPNETWNVQASVANVISVIGDGLREKPYDAQ